MKTIYSIRTSLGRELWWSTSRRKTLALAADVNAPGEYITKDGHGAISTDKGLAAHELPLEVWKCSRVKAGAR